MKLALNKTLAAILLTCSLPATAGNLALTETQISAFGIELAAVNPVDSTLSKTFPAKVAVPNAKLRAVSALVDGVVETLLVAEGENIQKGQALATIRSARLLELQAKYLESRTRRMLSADTVERDRKLRADGIIAERRLLEAESVHRENSNAEARDLQALRISGMPEAAIKQLSSSQQLSALLTITAPFDGVVLEQIATAGQRLSEADPLYRIGDLETLWIEVHVPLNSLGNIRPGSQIALTELGLDAQVITVGRMVHGTDQGVLVRAEIKHGAEQLRPGQFVTAQLKHTADTHSLRLPSSAVVRDGDQDYVFVRNSAGFDRVAVTTIGKQANQSVINAPLANNAEVAVRGTAALKAAWASGGAE